MASLLRQLPRTVLRLSRSYAAEPVEQSGKISLTFLAPYQSYYSSKPVAQVNVPSTSGDFGILPNHVPSLAVLKPGVISVFETPDAKKDFFVSSGTITVNPDSSVQIVAEEAVPLDQLDVTAARHGLEKFTAKLTSSGSEAERLESEVSVEVYAAMVKALEHH